MDTGIFIRTNLNGKWINEDIGFLPQENIKEWLETKNKNYIIHVLLQIINKQNNIS